MTALSFLPLVVQGWVVSPAAAGLCGGGGIFISGGTALAGAARSMV